MTQLPVTGGWVPAWDKADRMRKALRESGIGVQDIASYLGVARTSVSNWINGRIEPSVQTLRLWAMKTGVSYEWLCHGDSDPCRPRRVVTGSAFRVAALVGVAA